MKIKSQYFDKDNLIYAEHLFFENNKLYLKNEPQIFVYPSAYAKQIFNIINQLNLWNNFAFKIQLTPPMIARAPIFGVNFEKAIYKLLKVPFIKSKFSVIEKEKNSLNADLI